MDHDCQGTNDQNGRSPRPRSNFQGERSKEHRELWSLVAREGREELQSSRDLLRLLMGEVWDQAAARCLIARIEASKARLEQLVADASEIADPPPLELQSVHLGLIFAESWNRLIAARSPCHARLRQQGHGLDLRCQADPARLARVFFNLLEESFEATEGPVYLTVSWSVDRLGDRPALRLLIRDEGPPLDRDRPEGEKYLDALSTTRSGDLGLGLAAARTIVQQHGGELRLQEHDGPGLEYVVLLPKAPGEDAKDLQPATPPVDPT
ncbi:hypothetical protein BH23PLA1_BH23PLA1_41860 [soil metagenome]